MSQHKNYFDKYGQDRDRFVQKEIIYYQTSIFSLFSQKFQKDAQKDWENQKKNWQNGEKVVPKVVKKFMKYYDLELLFLLNKH